MIKYVTREHGINMLHVTSVGVRLKHDITRQSVAVQRDGASGLGKKYPLSL